MRKVVFSFLALASILAPALVVGAQAQGLAGYGVVLLHGKKSEPGGVLSGVAAALRAEGARVVTPEMPWSTRRLYDAGYEEAMREIDRAVGELKSQGAQKIVVAGQSLGGNAAVGYGARRSGLAAVIAFSPGHLPERPGFQERLGHGVARAKQLVAAGKGDMPASFPDFDQGGTVEERATPRVYLSYFDPGGPAVIPRNAAAMKPVPILWVIGRNDRLAALGPGYAYNRAAKHPKSRYLEVNGGHKDAPEAAKTEVVAWLKSL